MPTYSVSTAFNGIDRVSNAFINMGRASDRFKKKSNRNFKSASKQGSMFGAVLGGNLVAGALTKGLGMVKAGLGSIITEASKIEDARASFQPIMGGAKQAAKLVNRLNKEAATTPFQFENIAGVAKQLLPVLGDDINAVAGTFRMLGDTAGGNAQKLETITRGFTKALLKGKPDLESLNMIGEAGVPIFTEMAKGMGISVQQLLELSKKGKLTNKDLTKTFKSMTSEGGIFYKGMAIASETVSGKFSTLRDNVSLTAGNIGLQLFPVIKKVTDILIKAAGNVREWVESNKELINQRINLFVDSVVNGFKKLVPFLIKTFNFIKKMWPLIKLLAGAFLLWKIAIVGVQIALKGMAIIGMIGKFLQFVKIVMMITKAKGVWAAAQWALNAAMNANPIGLIVIGIVALIAVIVVVVKYWDQITAAVMRAWEWFDKYRMLIFAIIGPIGLIANMTISLVKGLVKTFLAFKNGGIIEGFKELGRTIFDFLITPLESFLTLLAKIPGIGKVGELGLEGIEGLRGTMGAGEGDADRPANFAPNASKEEGRRRFMEGEGTLIVKANPGTEIVDIDNGLSGVNVLEGGPN